MQHRRPLRVMFPLIALIWCLVLIDQRAILVAAHLHPRRAQRPQLRDPALIVAHDLRKRIAVQAEIGLHGFAKVHRRHLRIGRIVD